MAETHIIHKQIFEVEFPSKEQAIIGQNKLNQMFTHRVLPLLNKQFDRITGSERLVLDKLEIDLGVLSENNFEEQFLEKLGPALADQLLVEYQTSHQQHPSDPNGPYSAKRAYTNGKRNPEPKSPDRAELGPAGEFGFFLANGRLPWWSDGRHPSELADVLICDHSGEWLKLLRNELSSKNSRHRLIYQLSDSQLQSIFLAEKSGYKSGNQITHTLRDLLKLHKKEPIIQADPAHLRLLFWESALCLFIVKETGTANHDFGFFLRKNASATSKRTAPILLNMLTHFGGRAQLQVTKIKKGKTVDALSALILKLRKTVKISGLENSELAKLLDAIDLKSTQKLEPDSNIFSDYRSESGATVPNQGSNHRSVPIKQKETVEILNAGLVLLAQFLPHLFDGLDFIENKSFVSEEQAVRAAQILQYVCSGEAETPEHQMILNKVLCGLEVDTPIPGSFTITQREQDEVDHLLSSVIDHWKALKGTSVWGLRQTFLNRQGLITRESNGWSIYVDRTSVDVLIDHLPWSLSIIKLPWHNEMIHVEW